MKITMITLAFAAIALGACDKGGPAATCEQVAPHMNELMVAEAPADKQAEAKADLAAELTKTIADCKTKNMSPEAMQCLLASKATSDFGKCK